MSAARHTFLAKPIAAIALIALAQWLFYDRWWGATLGGFALAWIVAFVVARRDVRRFRPVGRRGRLAGQRRARHPDAGRDFLADPVRCRQIGSASCRESVCQYV